MEYLYTIENLKMILGPSQQPKIKLSDCRICSKLPDRVSKVNVPSRNEFGSFPYEVTKLEEFIIIKYTWQILMCPLCCRLYTDEYHYEYLAGGSEDVYVISRLEYHDALEMLREIKAKKLTKEDHRWLVTW
ncbi:MAG: hypothetical protein A2176_01380 [Spirochaetes bacterium RBG_13_51_14]|nr:MAG: hypothetical protein A2176_01380 [Spirochaetes bacterium RBG_13_51_14]